MSLDEELQRIHEKVRSAEERIKTLSIKTTIDIDDEDTPPAPFEVTEDGINLGSLSLGLEEIFKSIEQIIRGTVNTAVASAEITINSISELLKYKEGILNQKLKEHLQNIPAGETKISPDELLKTIRESLEKAVQEHKIEVNVDELIREIQDQLNVQKSSGTSFEEIMTAVEKSIDHIVDHIETEVEGAIETVEEVVEGVENMFKASANKSPEAVQNSEGNRAGAVGADNVTSDPEKKNDVTSHSTESQSASESASDTPSAVDATGGTFDVHSPPQEDHERLSLMEKLNEDPAQLKEDMRRALQEREEELKKELEKLRKLKEDLSSDGDQVL